MSEQKEVVPGMELIPVNKETFINILMPITVDVTSIDTAFERTYTFEGEIWSAHSVIIFPDETTGNRCIAVNFAKLIEFYVVGSCADGSRIRFDSVPYNTIVDAENNFEYIQHAAVMINNRTVFTPWLCQLANQHLAAILEANHKYDGLKTRFSNSSDGSLRYTVGSFPAVGDWIR